tara:strand:- start:524 stop:1015 length:492 start_codon:yes stop_codon:yes gene_type:complete
MSNHRWVVSGTALPRSLAVDDSVLHRLQGMMSFLGVHPLDNLSYFRNSILKALKDDETREYTNVLLRNLISIMMVRTRADVVAAECPLPELKVQVVLLSFNNEERFKYSAAVGQMWSNMLTATPRVLDLDSNEEGGRYISRERKKNEEMNIFWIAIMIILVLE